MLARGSAIALVTLFALPAAAPAAPLERDLDRLARGAGDIAVHVSDARTRRTMYARRSSTARALASMTKLFTASVALEKVPEGVATTALVTARPDEQGVVRGDLVLLGGGDPTYGSMLFNDRTYGGPYAAAERLANAIAATRLRRLEGAVVGDESLFDTLRGPAGPLERDLDGSLSALAYNRGREIDFGPEVLDPARAAADALDDLLDARGVTIRGRPRVGQAPREATESLAAVRTGIRDLVRLMLRDADHYVAEMVAKRFAAAEAVPGTTAAAVAIMRRETGAPARFHDASGLNPLNRATPRQVGSIVRGLNRGGDRTLMAVPGRGHLAGRGISALARRRCRAVGTTGDGANIAGLCRTRRGGMIAFAIQGGPKARSAADRMVAAIAQR